MSRQIIFPLLLVFLLSLNACGRGNSNSISDQPEVSLDEQSEIDTPKQITKNPNYSFRIPVRNIGHLYEVFNDSNKYQYEYAEKLGIDPINSLYESYHTKQPLRHIKTCDYYRVDKLTHSLPFLIPQASDLLKKIGENFIDSLSSRGAGKYRIIVTSLLRTGSSVRNLRRVNVNATDSSTHKFGTTFDLTYSRFDCLDSTRPIHDGDLKNLLAEVLFDLRNQGRCLVKFEKKTSCFHVTAIR